MIDLAAEMGAARAALTVDNAEMLCDYGVPAHLIDLYQMVGRVHARVEGETYTPDAEAEAGYVTPVLLHYVDTPETTEGWYWARFGQVVDLVLWDPRSPLRSALRRGTASWAGTIPPQYLSPPRTAIRRGILDWLQADLDGLVLLGSDRAEHYRLLSGMRGGITVEPEGAQRVRRILARPWPLPDVIVRQGAIGRAA